MLRRYLSLIILVPLAVLLIAFAVANRHIVNLSFDPLNATDPAISTNLPMFVIIFAAIALGLLLGGIATWFTQGKHRKLARERRQEAAKWRFEAEQQKQSQQLSRFDQSPKGSPSLPKLPPSKAA